MTSLRAVSRLVTPFALAASFVACGPTALQNEEAYSRVHSDSGIDGPSFAGIVDELKNLERAHPTVAKVLNYGTSVRGAQLTVIRIMKEGITPAGGGKRPAVMITGTIHGDEFLDIENRLPRFFLENQTKPGVAAFLAAGGAIYVAPILNPDGYASDRRENDRGQDLNRDFDMKLAGKSGFKHPETKGLLDFLKAEQTALNWDLKLTLDYHCCVGALIYPWGHSETRQLPAAELAEHKRLANKMLGRFGNYPSGQAYQIVGYTAVGASDDWFHETFGATSFTFEGAQGRENRNFQKHTDMWDELLADKAGPAGTGGVVVPVTGVDQSLFLAVAADLGGGQLRLAVAGQGAQSIGLCRGAADACRAGSSAVVVRFVQGRPVGDRVVFSDGAAVTVAAGETWTLLSYDAAGAVKGARAVQFAAR
jgi:hypothetical protein